MGHAMPRHALLHVGLRRNRPHTICLVITGEHTNNGDEKQKERITHVFMWFLMVNQSFHGDEQFFSICF